MKKLIKANKENILYGSILLTQVLFIVLKVNEIVDWSWWVISLPILFIPIIYVLLWVGLFFYFFTDSLRARRKMENMIREVKDVSKEIEDVLEEMENGNNKRPKE